LLTLLSFFVAFNRIVPVSALARLAPRALQDFGVVVLISLTYVPETVRHMRRIREAQAVRGHQVRGLRDWQPLVVPLLVGGMERAMALAEAMVSRGFGAARGRRQPPWVLAGLATALVFILAGWMLLLWWGWPGWMLLIAGAASIVALLWHAGKRAPATRYRPRPWQAQDMLLLLVALLPLGPCLFPLLAGGWEARPLFFSYISAPS
jgi:energy-coupling factor transport system permease protein